MKSAIDKEHLKIHKDQDNNLFLKMCNKGLSCPICFKVLDRVTKKELQVYAEEKFKIENQYLLSLEWTIPLSSIELDPLLLDKLENGIKNFLKKNEKMDAICRLDLNHDLSSINVSLLIMSSLLTSLRVDKETLSDWTISYPTQVYFRDVEWVDKYEFYVWAVPFSYGKEELDFISELSEESKLKTRLENRVVIIEGDKSLQYGS